MIFVLYFILIIFLAHIYYFIFFKTKNHKMKIIYSLIIIFLFSIIFNLIFIFPELTNDFEKFKKNLTFMLAILTNIFLLNYLSHFLITKINFAYNYCTYIIIFFGISFFLTLLSFVLDVYIFDLFF